MNSDLEILAIIPARKGSKGLPGKNIRLLCGRPLIAYTIEQALRSDCFDRVVVSTDGEEIAGIAREHGADVPFLRPEELAGDRADLRSAINHLLDELAAREGYRPDVVSVLFATYPFRTKALIEEVVDGACTKAVWSQCAYPIETNPAELVTLDGRQEWPALRPLLEQTLVHPAAHVGRRLLSLMGSIRAEVNLPPGVRQGDTSPLKRSGYFEAMIAKGDRRFETLSHNTIVNDPVLRIDIDSEEDFWLAERVISEGLFEFEQCGQLS
jgi:CMP-N-acetylneuraminic acid synthetase